MGSSSKIVFKKKPKIQRLKAKSKQTSAAKTNRKKEMEVKRSDKSLDSKIEELVTASKNQNYSSVDISYVRKPTLGVNKSKKSKQPNQLNGMYKKPSLMSNYALSLSKPGSQLTVRTSKAKSNSQMCHRGSFKHEFTRNNMKINEKSSSCASEIATTRKVNQSFKSEGNGHVFNPINFETQRSIISPDRDSVSSKHLAFTLLDSAAGKSSVSNYCSAVSIPSKKKKNSLATSIDISSKIFPESNSKII